MSSRLLRLRGCWAGAWGCA